MAAPRKSQLYLHSILPVTRSHDQVVSDKLKPGKFVVTPTGLTKALGLVSVKWSNLNMIFGIWRFIEILMFTFGYS